MGVAAARAASPGGRLSDQSLLSAARAGSDNAFLVLYDRYRDLAWRVARSVATNDVDAEDAVSEGFARIYAVNAERDIESFRAYLAATVRNAATDIHRRRERPAGGVESVEPPATGPGVEEQVLDLREQALVTEAFASLPERYRTALWLAEVERFTTAEVGHVVGVTANGAAALCVRARERLRQAYLAQHVRHAEEPACASVAPDLAAHVRGSTSTRVARRVEEHVGRCRSCAGRLDELKTLNQSLPAVIPPAPVGLAAGERILARVDQLRAAGAGRPVGLGGRTLHDAGSRLAESVSSLTHVGAPYAPTAPSVAERLVQPVAAAIAGLIVAGVASVSPPQVPAAAADGALGGRAGSPVAALGQGFEGPGAAHAAGSPAPRSAVDAPAGDGSDLELAAGGSGVRNTTGTRDGTVDGDGAGGAGGAGSTGDAETSLDGDLPPADDLEPPCACESGVTIPTSFGLPTSAPAPPSEAPSAPTDTGAGASPREGPLGDLVGEVGGVASGEPSSPGSEVAVPGGLVDGVAGEFGDLSAT